MRTTRTRRGALAAALLATVVTAAPSLAAGGEETDDAPGRSEQQGHPVVLESVEQDCVEINTFRRADPAAVAAALPDGWRPNVLANGSAQTLFVDYTCSSFSFDGLPARRTSVSWLVATNAIGPDGKRRNWSLSHGSDNPLFVQRLRKLGVESRYLPATTVTLTPSGDGTSQLVQSFVDRAPGGGIDYARTATVPSQLPATVSAPGGVFWFETDGAPVVIAYQNDTSPALRVALGEDFAPDSLLQAGFGIADVPAGTRSNSFSYLAGSWTSTATRQG